ncbi:MAG: ABC transporter substrate-binding protein [Proteobacteria bacterium]|nr:ABC transporter substrate-binding protein [Pseudomonadota bacterium]
MRAPAALALIAALLAGLMSWSAAAEQPLEAVRLQLKWRHQFQFAGYYAAIEKGYYREAGLDVRLLEATDQEAPAEVVLRGGAEYGIAPSDLVLLRSRGRPVVALAVIFQHSPYALVAAHRSGIEHLHDLVGKRVMIEHDVAELLAYLAHEGVGEDRLVMVPHTFEPKALIDGSVDAISVYTTDELFQLEQAGLEFRVFSPRAGGIDFYGDTLFTTEAEIHAHPRRVAALVAASLKGWAYALDHPAEIVDLILSRYSRRHSREHLLFEADQSERLIRHELVELGHMNPGPTPQISQPSFSALYIDDNPASIRLMTSLLAELPNVRVLTAPLGAMGVELAIAHRPDIIIVDIQLPDISGYDVLARLKAAPQTQGIPVLALSGDAMPHDVERGRAAGFVEYLTKPFRVADLLQTLERVLDGAARQGASAGGGAA